MAADKVLDAYDIKSGMNDDLYKALKDFKDQSIKSKEWDTLTKEDQRYVEKTI